MFGGAGVGKTLIMELIRSSRRGWQVSDHPSAVDTADTVLDCV